MLYHPDFVPSYNSSFASVSSAGMVYPNNCSGLYNAFEIFKTEHHRIMIIKYAKKLIRWILGKLGYIVIRKASMVGILPEVIHQVQPIGQPRIEGYQLEMATYHIKTGMGDAEPEFFPLYEQCCKYTMISWDRLYSLFMAVNYIVKSDIQGDIVECGVWRGGSMMMAALVLLKSGHDDRQFFLYDTFEGLPKPDDIDVDVWGHNAIEAWLPHKKTNESSDWAYASVDEVRANLERTGYPMKNIKFVKGMVEQTIPKTIPNKIALLRLDTDWYKSTRHELEHLYPRLSRNGVLIIDDYGHFRGSRQATDEYFAKLKMPPLLNRIDYSERVAIKPD